MTDHYQKGGVPAYIASKRLAVEDAIDMYAATRRLEARCFGEPVMSVEEDIAQFAEQKRAELQAWERDQ